LCKENGCTRRKRAEGPLAVEDGEGVGGRIARGTGRKRGITLSPFCFLGSLLFAWYLRPLKPLLFYKKNGTKK